MDRSHDIVLPHNRGLEFGGGGTETYVVSFTWILKLVGCLVERYTAKANNPGRLRQNFMYRNWKLRVTIAQEVLEPLPRCDQ